MSRRKSTTKQNGADSNQFDENLIDQLLKNYQDPQDIFGEGGLLKQLKKALTERILSGELSAELGYEKHDMAGNNSGNSRNGYSEKTLLCKEGDITIKVPRDRNGSYEPKLIPKHQTRFDEMDEKIISLYARGMTTRDIQAQLADLYGTEVSATLISNVTNEVIEEVKAWQSRPLDTLYPIVWMDALMIKVRQDKRVINKSFYLALGVSQEGQKELLGIWISENEGAKFWLNVLTELKNRGVSDIFIACVDGLSGFPEAIESIYPQTEVQLCIVHMVRNSLRYVGWKERKAVAADLRTIYSASTVAASELALDAFCEKWDAAFPSIGKSWRRHWERIIPFLNYPQEIRKVIYTTNAIGTPGEAWLNKQVQFLPMKGSSAPHGTECCAKCSNALGEVYTRRMQAGTKVNVKRASRTLMFPGADTVDDVESKTWDGRYCKPITTWRGMRCWHV